LGARIDKDIRDQLESMDAILLDDSRF